MITFKRLLLCLLFSLPLFAQVTAVKNTTTTVTAVAGTITCTFSSATPVPPVGVTAKTCGLRNYPHNQWSASCRVHV